MKHHRLSRLIRLDLLLILCLILSVAGSHPSSAAGSVPFQLYMPVVISPYGPGPAALPDPLPAAERDSLYHLGFKEWARYRGDPVNTATGNHVQQFTDLHIPGMTDFDLLLQRTYNSLDGRDGLFGFGWSSLLDMSLRLATDGSVDVRYPDGSGAFFVASGGGYAPGQGGVFDVLAGSGTDFTLTRPDQVVYHFVQFGDVALLTALRDRHANTISISRNSIGDPIQIIDSAGRQYDLTYTGDHIATIADPLGRVIAYAYDSNGDLVAVTNANGGITTFAYDLSLGKHLLTTLTDPEGILYLTNHYDSQGRVTEQVDADSSHAFFAYAGSAGTGIQTLFTDYLGNQTQDNYDALSRVTSIVDALGFVESFVYDGDNNVIQYTDRRGNIWASFFDSHGNLLSETNPLGFKVFYTYNATNDLTSFTDSGGFDGAARSTNYIYDASGNLVQVDRPDGTTVSASYDVTGQKITATDSLSNTTTFEYDGDGNRIRTTDPLGNATEYTYDIVGRLMTMQDANGGLTVYEYDDNDNPIQTTDPRGNAALSSHDLNDNLIETIDRRGGLTKFDYLTNLKLGIVTDPEGHTTTYAYDAMYNRTSATDANGNVTRYRYDALYRLIEVEDPAGGITRFDYDENDNIISMTNALGHATTFAYDLLNRVVAYTDALGATTSFIYDEVGRLTVRIDPLGAITRTIYDFLDRPTQVRDALGGVWQTDYDAASNAIREIDANGHATSRFYDQGNRLTTIIDPEAHATHLGYDGVGNVINIIDALGNVTTYTYDENNNVTHITDALGNVQTYTYDEEGLPTAFTDANGHTTLRSYDLDRQLTTLTEAGGQVTTFEYDSVHNLIGLTNAKGNRWLSSYDLLNQPIEEIDPLGNSTRYAYDMLGRQTGVTDANGIVTRYDYDAVDRLVAVIQNYVAGLGSNHETNVTTRYAYDILGNLISVTDANGAITTYSHDLLNRLLQETNPLGHSWQYQYDLVGNLIRRIDAKGQVTDYTYDADDLISAIVYPDGSRVDFRHDAVHNQTSMTDWLGTINNTYDALNRLISSANHLGQTVSSAYDAVGNRTSLTYPEGDMLRFDYDETNAQIRMFDPDGNVFEAVRDATHNIVVVDYPNRTTVAYTYDAAERLIRVHNTSRDGDLISLFDYDLDPVGNRTRLESQFGWRKPLELNVDYLYDPLYRLIRSDDSLERFTSYAYDAVGNRLEMVTNFDPTTSRRISQRTTSYTYNQANQLLSATAETVNRCLARRGSSLTEFSYDENGNRAQRTQQFLPHTDGLDADVGLRPECTELQWGYAGRLRTDYTYDFEDRLVGVQNFRASHWSDRWLPQDETLMTYDGYGRLFRTGYAHLRQPHKNGGQKWREYVYDGLDPIVEYLEPSPRQVNYYRGLASDGAGAIAPILSMDDREGQGQGSLNYFYYDGLGSVSALTNHNGHSVHTYRYDDFGLLLDVNGRPDDSSNYTAPHNRFTFTGKEWDEHTALYNFGARYYDPAVGLWLTQDIDRGRLVDPMSLHRTGYAANNPINFTDPYGFDRSAMGGAKLPVAPDLETFAMIPEQPLSQYCPQVPASYSWLCFRPEPF